MVSRLSGLLAGLQLSVPQNKLQLQTLLSTTTDSVAPATSTQRATGPKRSGTLGDIVQDHLATEDLRNLRLVSKGLKEWVIDFHPRIFNTLSIGRRFSSPRQEELFIYALITLAPFCRHFIILLDEMLHSVPLLLGDGQQIFDTAQSAWMSIFAILHGLATLTISAPGDPDWNAFGTGEAFLESIRVALETKLPRGLHKVTLSPINATGLLHLRWRGAAFQETSWTAQSLWTRLTHLTIDLHNPLLHYKKSNKKDFVKTLHDYLDSFNRSLQALRFSWIGEAGPNPLLLDLRYGGRNFSSPMIKWTALEKIFLKNVLADDGDLVALRRTRVPRLKHFELEDEMMKEKENGALVWEDDEEVMVEEEHAAPRGDSPLMLFGPLSM